MVIGCLDPFPEVSGRGVRMLREAGVEVVTGVMEKEAWELNRVFMTFQEKAAALHLFEMGAECGRFYGPRADG